MAKIITTDSNIFFIFGDVVDDNVLKRSREGLDKIRSVGRDITSDMVMLISSISSFRKFRV